MITEQQVLDLYNHAGLRTATSAKPRMVMLGVGNDQGVQFGSLNNEKYFFIERVWFSWLSASKFYRETDFYLQVSGRPNEANLVTPNAPFCIHPVAHTETKGAVLDGVAIEPYCFARQLTYVPVSFGQFIGVRLLIWEIEE